MDDRTKAIDSAVRNHDGAWAAATAAYDAGVAAERERCATWLELADGNRDQREHAAKLAALIRKA